MSPPKQKTRMTVELEPPADALERARERSDCQKTLNECLLDILTFDVEWIVDEDESGGGQAEK